MSSTILTKNQYDLTREEGFGKTTIKYGIKEGKRKPYHFLNFELKENCQLLNLRRKYNKFFRF